MYEKKNKDGNIVIMFRVNCAEPREKSSITLTVWDVKYTLFIQHNFGLVYGVLLHLSTIFQIYRGGQFYW